MYWKVIHKPMILRRKSENQIHLDTKNATEA